MKDLGLLANFRGEITFSPAKIQVTSAVTPQTREQ